VSVFDGPNLPHLVIVKAHEDFVDELKASGMNYAVIRPTGYFSDMGQFFDMARKGRVYLFGRAITESTQSMVPTWLSAALMPWRAKSRKSMSAVPRF